MCLLAIQYKSVPEAPILVAANREEAYDRASLVPSIQPGKPRVPGQPGKLPLPKKPAGPTGPGAKFYEAKAGFANYWFNRQERDRLHPVGLYDLGRKPRRVGKEYRRLIREWREFLPTGTSALMLV